MVYHGVLLPTGDSGHGFAYVPGEFREARHPVAIRQERGTGASALQRHGKDAAAEAIHLIRRFSAPVDDEKTTAPVCRARSL